ncbi:DUF6808 domain-containing protein [Alistipes sp.]|uniref:DUF6808 domain-containing protein n=1 Tax=Alistipes sp. TaxID=1872444 RepID=UPI0031FC6281
MKPWIVAAVALAAAFFGGWWLGQRAARTRIVERVRVDTLFYERPTPFAAAERTLEVNVPRLLFAPSDTVERLVVVGDSVRITVTERTLEYRDSTYYARVVGPVVGQLGPRLDYLETYNKTVERVQLVREPYAWELGPAMGTWMTSDGSGVWAGAYARRTFGRFSVSASAGYDARNKSAFGQIEAGVALWRR